MQEHEFRTVALFQCLSNPVRYQILKALDDGECIVSELAKKIHRKSQNVSQHLRILRQFNLVRFRTENKKVFYRLKRREVLRLLEKAEDFEMRKK